MKPWAVSKIRLVGIVLEAGLSSMINPVNIL
jgi:hypothetical protein